MLMMPTGFLQSGLDASKLKDSGPNAVGPSVPSHRRYRGELELHRNTMLLMQLLYLRYLNDQDFSQKAAFWHASEKLNEHREQKRGRRQPGRGCFVAVAAGGRSRTGCLRMTE